MWRQSERDKEKNGVKENNKNGQSEEIKAKRGKEKKKDKRTFSIHSETKDLQGEKTYGIFLIPVSGEATNISLELLNFVLEKKRPDFNSARQIHDSRICNSLTKFEYGPAKRACTFNGA